MAEAATRCALSVGRSAMRHPRRRQTACAESPCRDYSSPGIPGLAARCIPRRSFWALASCMRDEVLRVLRGGVTVISHLAKLATSQQQRVSSACELFKSHFPCTNSPCHSDPRGTLKGCVSPSILHTLSPPSDVTKVTRSSAW